MDVLALGKANKTLRRVKEIDDQVAPLAESRFPSVDARLDWLEGQANNLVVQNSHQVDLSKGTFVNTGLANGKIQLRKIEEANRSYSGNIVPAMTKNSLPSGLASASSEFASTLGAYQAFDGASDTYWSTVSGVIQGWLQYEFPESKVISKYAMIASNNIIALPRNWTFEGSKTGLFSGEQVILDSQSLISWSANVKQEFKINNLNDFKFYRINVSGNNGGTKIHISQLEMMEYANSYIPSGSYESPIIDLGEGWKETKLVDVVKQIKIGTTNSAIELSTSTDGITFSPYAALNAILPQARYVKMRATLTATPQPGEVKAYEFNQPVENKVTLNEFTKADGDLKLITDYVPATVIGEPVGIGQVFTTTIQKSKYKRINTLEVK